MEAHGHDKEGDIDAEDIKRLNEEDAVYVATMVFWEYFRAGFILNQSVAEFFVDWGYNSGRKTVAKQLKTAFRD